MRPSRRVLAAAAGSYVGAWLAGLAVAPAAPAPDAAPAAVAAFFSAHATATTVQSLLIHGVAGVALLVLASALAAGRAARAAGAAAAITSLGQAATGVALSQAIAGHASGDAAKAVFTAINTADTVKLVFLAAFVVLVSRGFGPWMRRAGHALAALLAVGGLAFVTGSSALYAALAVGLPALLAWVAAVAVAAWRARLQGAAA
jgi:hypothetical protein